MKHVFTKISSFTDAFCRTTTPESVVVVSSSVCQQQRKENRERKKTKKSKNRARERGARTGKDDEFFFFFEDVFVEIESCRVENVDGNQMVEVFFDNVYRSNRGRADVGRGDENDERSKRGGRCRVRVCETEIVQTRDANAVGEAVSSSDGTRNY